ncbi:MAG TPA: SDR family NAD(P)-dependent oxidoreductase [Flavitalea sp.]|nr:SDR family NAD(P)-dependent oxidoreductase [Flavitalea sp.]
MSRIALVTGATSGFGKAIAEKFAAEKYQVIITGRRKEKLETTAEFIRKKYNAEVLTLCFDVRERKAVEEKIGNLPAEWTPVSLLVNNAGLALGRDFFDDAQMDDWETMIDTNLKGLIYVTRALLPQLKKSDNPQIINIGSTAAKEVYEKGNVYCTSKHAVDALSQSMRIDLLRHGIKVTAVHPGAAETEFSLVRFKGDEEMARSVYQGFTPLSAVDVANVVFYCSSLPPHVCINDLVVTGTAQANSYYFHKSQ